MSMHTPYLYLDGSTIGPYSYMISNVIITYTISSLTLGTTDELH